MGTEYSRYIIYIKKSIFSEYKKPFIDTSPFVSSNLVTINPSRNELLELLDIAEKIMSVTGSRDYRPAKKYDLRKGAILTELFLNNILTALSDGRGEVFSTSHSYIQDVLQLITENLSEPMTVDELAARFNVGHTKFASDFRDATGSSYKSYITDLRMTRARELLSAGMSIISVSMETGYSSEAHFISAFRKYWNMTPGQMNLPRQISSKDLYT